MRKRDRNEAAQQNLSLILNSSPYPSPNPLSSNHSGPRQPSGYTPLQRARTFSPTQINGARWIAIFFIETSFLYD